MRDPAPKDLCAPRFEYPAAAPEWPPATSERIEQHYRALLESGEFDEDFYRRKAGLHQSADPVRHYLTKGWQLGLAHRPSFDASFLLPYYEAAGFPGPPALTAMRFRAAHWPLYGTRSGAEAIADLVRTSGLFDEAGYRARLGPAQSKLDPALHYVLAGERLGLPPSPHFDPLYYYESHKDVAAAAICLLAHYLEHGKAEGRRPLPFAHQSAIDLSGLTGNADCIVLIVPAGESGLLALEIGRRLAKRHDLITLLLDDGAFAEEFAAISAAVIAIEPTVQTEVELGYYVGLIQRQKPIRLAVAAGIGCLPALSALGLQFVPVVALLDWIATLQDFIKTRKALGFATAALFSTGEVAASFAEFHPGFLRGRFRVLPGSATEALAAIVEEAGNQAIATMRQRAEDFATINEDSSFEPGLFLLTAERNLSRPQAIAHYLAHWSAHRTAPMQDTPRFLRRPALGFHPQIYADHHRGLGDVDPLADFIRGGKQAGAWLHRVISGKNAAVAPSRLRTVIQGHFYYPDLIGDFLNALAPNRSRCDLLLSSDDAGKAEILKAATRGFERGNVQIRIGPNRGRDIGPLLTLFGNDLLKDYDIVGHFHAKRSLTADLAIGESWRAFLWQHLLGNRRPMMDVALEALSGDQRLGLIFAEDPNLVGWDADRHDAEELAVRAGVDKSLPTFFEFPIGTMFWARTAALAPLIELKLAWNDYPEEPLPPDGTLLNALERFLPFAARKAGFSFATTHLPGITWSLTGD